MSKNGRLSVGVAAIFLTAANLLGRGMGFLREVIFAKEFGLSQDFDIYLAGAIIPLILNTSLLYFAQNFFIPHYHYAAAMGEDVKQNFFNKSFIYFVGAGILIASLMYLFKGVIIGQYLWNSSEEVKSVAENVLAIFILSIPINFTISLINSFLFAEFKYVYPAISQLFLNVVVIASVLLLSGVYGVYSIAVGFLGGYLLQLVFLLTILIRKFSFNPFSSNGQGKFTKGIKVSLLVILFIEVVNQFHLLVDRYFINFISEGGISTLNYASILYVTPITIISGALSTALFPALSENFSVKKTDTLKEQFITAAGMIIFLFIPLSTVYIFWGEGIIDVIYKRGVFSAGDVLLTADVLKIYAFSMVIYAVYAIVNKLIFSSGLYRYLFYISIVVVGSKVIMNFLFAETLQQNGLALSSSIAYAGIGIAGFILVNHKLKLKVTGNILKKGIMIGLVSVGSWLFVDIFFTFIHLSGIYSQLLKILFFGLVYAYLSYELKINEVIYLTNYVKSRISKV